MTQRHQTKDKGDLAVAKTILNLRKHGIYTCLPISEHLPFDLIAVMPDMRTLRRVQVKYRADTGVGAFDISFRSNYYDSKKIYSKKVDLDEIDTYGVYCPDSRDCYYLRVDEIPLNAISLSMRLRPAKNGQKKDIWLASDYADAVRIAPLCDKVTTSKREVSELDELAITVVTADLMEKGVQVIIPQSQYVPFDMIGVMSDMKTMYRIRVGYERVCVSENVDQYAIVNPHDESISYVNAEEIPVNVKFLTMSAVAG